MSAFLFRIFLSLSVLLLSGSGSLSAHASDQRNCYSREAAEYVGFFTAQEKPSLIVNPAESHHGIPFLKMVATEPRAEEEDEHEQESIKKKSGSSYIVATFGAEALHYFFSDDKKALSFHHYFSYTASYRYLAFKVFRI